MYFKYPELLYALFLLIIPFIVHLFQLRRFQKEDFTNVKFLKKISRQTRKSSHLKKWLILLVRCLTLACIILAFAQPYFPSSEKALQSKSTLFYLDNSFSMQASGKNGELLPAAVQGLLKNIPEEGKFNLLTNDDSFLNTNVAEIRNILQEIDYSATAMNFDNLKLRAAGFFENNPADNHNFILISDFQQSSGIDEDLVNEADIKLVPLQPENVQNISLDSAFIAERDPDKIKLQVLLSATGNVEEQISVSVSNGKTLLGKSAVNFAEKDTASLSFSLSSELIANGIIQIEDNGLEYDNQLFFNIASSPAIQTVLLSEKGNSFLKRIYTEPEFSLSTFSFSGIDYNSLSQAGLIILEEPESIPVSLSEILGKRMEEGAVVVLLPSMSGNINSYNSFLADTQAPHYTNLVAQERLVTGIRFGHPLFNAVFEEEVNNFQYPKVNTYYKLNSPGSMALQYQNNDAFLTQQGQLFLFTAALNVENSNFRNSPLVVPTFYNIGRMALQRLKLYYQLNKNNVIDIPVSSAKDEVLTISSEEENFIPQQQSFSEKIQITTDDLPETAGNYQVLYRDETIEQLSYNYNRSESELQYINMETLENADVIDGLDTYFENENALSEIHALWKWFVIFALVFLLLEMLLLKFLK
ncbi:BatA domain-containing protein [Zunongwangia sp. F363]|uniref:BatA domain-containing protein n=1 Tax=Autumnicola tepida TaxID=3075595 RepID=A0ABU3CCI7_9FLAO|nr:BatA domain-containing protein [Zunongwangia sp. F363]MDT0644045.1 BatA domain-containing protein [Zunongwangia sp. F363]